MDPISLLLLARKFGAFLWKALTFMLPIPVLLVCLVAGGYHVWRIHQVRAEAADHEKKALVKNDAKWAEWVKGENKVWEGKLKAQEEQSKAENEEMFKRLVKAQEDARKPAEQVIKEVVRYVPAAVDFTVNLGFLRGYAKAATGSEDAVAGLPSGPYEGATGTHLSTVLSTDALNLGECRANYAEVVTWRKWYVVNKAICEKTGVCQAPPQ